MQGLIFVVDPIRGSQTLAVRAPHVVHLVQYPLERVEDILAPLRRRVVPHVDVHPWHLPEQSPWPRADAHVVAEVGDPDLGQAQESIERK